MARPARARSSCGGSCGGAGCASATRSCSGTGTVEDGWLNQIRWLFWPAFKRAFENRRHLPERFARHPQLQVHRLRSDAEVEAFVQSIQATESMSGSSNGSERQKTPPLAET